MNFRSVKLSLIFIALSSAIAQGEGNQRIKTFTSAKRIAYQIHLDHPFTLYCNCKYEKREVDLKSCGYEPKKTTKAPLLIEWEHVVPAETFGHSFPEWREGAAQCTKENQAFRGRKCAQHNSEFRRMEADLYNLWPEISELNRLRQNFSMAELGAERSPSSQFGSCRARIENRKFEPMPTAKGRVARTYLYMDQAYPNRGIISEKNKKLFEAWDNLHPVDEWECKRARKIEEVQGNENPILKSRCKAFVSMDQRK